MLQEPNFKSANMFGSLAFIIASCQTVAHVTAIAFYLVFLFLGNSLETTLTTVWKTRIGQDDLGADDEG